MIKEFSIKVKSSSVEYKASFYSGKEAIGFHFPNCNGKDMDKVNKYTKDRPILIIQTLSYSGLDFAKTIFSKTFKGEPNNCLLVQLANSADKKEISKIQYDVARVALTQIEEQD